MNNRLLSFMAFVTMVGGAAVYTLGFNSETNQPTTLNDAVDAGILSNCAPRIGTCTVRLDVDGRHVAADAGWFIDDGGIVPAYVRVQTGVERCPGTPVQVVVPRVIAKGLSPDFDGIRFDFNSCTLSACAASPLCLNTNLGKPSNFVVDVLPCKRRPTGTPATQCMLQLADGGLYDFGDENVMPAAQAVGAGCVPAACVVFDSSEPP
jgi:hypothetical protein